MLSELDIHSLIQTRVVSNGRYGRTREIIHWRWPVLTRPPVAGFNPPDDIGLGQ